MEIGGKQKNGGEKKTIKTHIKIWSSSVKSWLHETLSSNFLIAFINIIACM